MEEKKQTWMRHAQFYMNSLEDEAKGKYKDVRGRLVLVVYFEDMNRNLHGELVRILRFLSNKSLKSTIENKPEVLDTFAKCGVYSPKGGFKRKRKKKDPYSLELRKELCGYFAPMWSVDKWGEC